MKIRNAFIAAVALTGLSLSATAWAGMGNNGQTGRPDWTGNGHGATFEVTTSGGATGGTDTTGSGDGTATDPADDPFLRIFTHTTPSGNVHTTTLTYGTNAEGQNILLEMQKLFTNHNGHVVDITRVFGVLPEPAPTPEPGTGTSTGTGTDSTTTGASQVVTGS